MELFLVRHAIAEPLRFPTVSRDEDRALTPEGRTRFRGAVEALLRMGIRLDGVWTSPLRRAVETADLLAPLLEGEVAKTELLAAPPSERLLARLDGECPALVGHEPWMSELLALLISGDPSEAGAFRFAKGAVAWLEGSPSPGGMQLRALWPPKTLAQLAVSSDGG